MTTPENAEATLKRFAAAKARRSRWDGLLRRAFAKVLPHHDLFGDRTEGADLTAEVFDGTAAEAVVEAAARMHGRLCPPWSKWLDFAPGGAVPAEAVADFNRDKERVRDILFDELERSNFHTEFDQAAKEAYISTGALLVHEGIPPGPAFRFEAVSIASFIPIDGPGGRVDTVFRESTRPWRDLATVWPDIILPAEAAKKRDDDPDGLVALVDACERDEAKGDWHYTLWLTDHGAPRGVAGDGPRRPVVERRYRTNPWVVFRMGKAPGEAFGRGPVLTVLSDILTLDKLVELSLKNASIAVTGIWQAEDDGVLNPANIKLVPGTIIPKAPGSTGLTPLEPAGKFDVARILTDELRARIRRAIVGPALPPVDGSVRSPTEYAERARDGAELGMPIALRLLSELVYPLAERLLDILAGPRWALIAPIKVDGKVVRLVPTSPLARAKEQAEAAASGALIQGYMTTMPQVVAAEVDLAAWVRWSLDKNGFPADLMKSPERKAEEAQAAQRMDQAVREQQLAADVVPTAVKALVQQGGAGNGAQ